MLKFKVFYRHIGRTVFCVGLFFLLTGCTAQSLDLSLSPTAEMGITRSTIQPSKSIAVQPFTDERSVMHGSDNAKWKGLVPGVLWIEISSDIPETYTAFSHYESKSLDRATTKAMVNILQQTGLFTDVVDLHKQPQTATDYLLSGEVYKTRVKETGYYYGSCIYAWLVRVLGLPYVSFDVEYHIGLQVTDTSSGKVMWQAEIKGSRLDKFYTVYSVASGRDGKHVIAWNISDILVQEFNKQVVDFEQTLVGH